VPSTVLCSKRNIILEWLIALRARASRVPDVGLGLLSSRKLHLDWSTRSSEQAAPCRSVEGNLNSKWGRRGFSIFLCRFSSAATSFGLKYPDRQKE
jgi:hypothetical protein